ncbi:hypothetical protein [Clostridium sp.]|uniref:hypothetical protein n=1 Tax=Clostridium sp. TaxID=1506 RepID=UPI003464E13A
MFEIMVKAPTTIARIPELMRALKYVLCFGFLCILIAFIILIIPRLNRAIEVE